MHIHASGSTSEPSQMRKRSLACTLTSSALTFTRIFAETIISTFFNVRPPVTHRVAIRLDATCGPRLWGESDNQWYHYYGAVQSEMSLL